MRSAEEARPVCGMRGLGVSGQGVCGAEGSVSVGVSARGFRRGFATDTLPTDLLQGRVLILSQDGILSSYFGPWEDDMYLVCARFSLYHLPVDSLEQITTFADILNPSHI